MSQCCKTCAHLAVQPDAAGRRVARRGGCYACVAPLPEMPALPESVTKAYGFEMPGRRRSWMQPDEGATCPAWTKYVKPEAA